MGDVEKNCIDCIETIEIPVEEYKKLLENVTRVRTFERYVNTCNGNIERKMCGIFLDFMVINYGEN